MIVKVDELQVSLNTARAALRDVVPVVDWADLRIHDVIGYEDFAQYIRKVSTDIRAALIATNAVTEDGAQYADTCEMATLIGIKQNEPGIWDMGMQARLDELVERWRK